MRKIYSKKYSISLLKKSKCLNSFLGDKRTNKKLLTGTMSLITLKSIDTVLELINSKTLYHENQWEDALNQLHQTKIEYNELSECSDNININNWLWYKTNKLGNLASRIKNTSIGILLLNLSNYMDLEQAVEQYKNITVPTNYRKSKLIFIY